MNLEQLIDCIPQNGRWELSKTKNHDPNKKYMAGWSDCCAVTGVKNLTGYGETPHQAMKNLVVNIKGPITEKNDGPHAW